MKSEVGPIHTRAHVRESCEGAGGRKGELRTGVVHPGEADERS
jgi:hypothetical protein